MRKRVKKEFFAEISTKELIEELKRRESANQGYIAQQIEKDTTRHK